MRAWLNTIRDFIIRAQVINGLGNDVRQTTKGRAIDATITVGGKKAPSIPPLPFILKDASNADNPSRLRVIAGVLSAGRFEFQGVPDGMSEGDDPPFYLTVSGTGYVYLEVTVSISEGVPEEITSVTVESGASVPADTATVGCFSLGTFNVDSSGDFDRVVPISAGGDVGYLYAGGHFFW